MKALLDTNVVLDVALEREPFWAIASRIVGESDFGDTHLFITASSATDIFYVLRKEKGGRIAWLFLNDLFACVDVCGVEKATLLAALESGFSDFEDAVQNAAAIECGLDAIVTRNKSDFQRSRLTVFTPEEFVAAHLS